VIIFFHIKKTKKEVKNMGNKKLMCGVLMVVFGFFVALFLTAGSANAKRLQEMHHSITLDTGNPYSAGPKDPIRWGGLPQVAPGFITRTALEKHNLVIRLTQGGLNEIGNLISDILKYDPSVANLINYFAMSFLDRCTDTKVVADFWDSLFEFQEWLTQNYSNNATKYYYYQTVATTACGIFPSSPGFSYGEGTTHCFGNGIYFEYIGGYNPTGTWDEGTNMCKDDGKGLFSMCLPIPLLNDEGAPICVNAVIYGQERNKQPYPPTIFFSGGFYWRPFGKCGLDLPGICPTSQGWDNYYFLDRVTGNRLIADYNRNGIRVTLQQNIGTDYPATATCEGDLTEHTSDDRLDIGIELPNFEIALTFTSPFVDSPIRYVDCNWVSGTCQFRDGVTSFPNELSFCFKNRAAVSDNHICDPQYDNGATGYKYDPARVISNYINGRAYIRIPILALRVGIQIKGNFTDFTNYRDWEHMVRGLGINLKALDVVAGVAYDFVPMSESITTPACWSTSWNQVGSVQYCPEYRVSQKFAKTLLWLDAVIRMIAVDTFDVSCISGHTVTQYDTCVAYFLFPGQVFDLKDIIKNLNPIDHPLEEVVYVGPTTYYEHKPNKIFIDFGFTNDFWADSAGIIIAANVGVDIRYVMWNSSATSITYVKRDYSVFNDYVSTCVQFASFVTAATSPIIPIPECQPQTGCPSTVRTVSTCPIVNGGLNPYVFATEWLPQAPAPSTLGEGRYGYSITNYYVGIGIHHNLISRVLFEAIGDGLACIWVDKYTPMLGGFAGGFLKTDSFGFFMPQLKEKYPGKDMAIEIIPNYKDPGNPSGNSGGAASYNTPLSVVAYAKTGGPTFRPVLSVYSSNSTRVNFWSEFLANATYGSSFTMFVQPSTWFDTADLMIDIPYLDLSFNVVTTGTITDPMASQTWMRIFGLTVGLMLSVDIDIVPCVSPDCARTVEFPPYESIDFSQPLTSVLRDYYTGQYLNETTNYFPYGGTFARVIDLTLYVDPDVRYFIAYNTNALGLSGSDWSEILGNILPVILNAVAGAKLRVAFDPAALLQLPIELNFPWVGPEFGTTLNWDQPFAGNPRDNVGDYFEIFIHWRGRFGLARIIKILKNFGIDLIDIISGVAGLSPKAVNLHLADGNMRNGFKVTPPETFITYTSDPHALYTKVEFSAWSPDSSKFRYSWRLDGGTWNLWQRENSVVLTHLLEGWHVLEVRAQDENKLIDPTPARFVFRIDSLGPDIRLTAPDMVRGSKFKAFVDVQDAQAKKSETLVSWKLDDAEWSEWVPASEITSIEINSLAKGEHILHIRAKDDVGNISTYSHRFFVTEKVGVLGCSSASATGLLPLIVMVLIGFAIISRRLRK
jgi:hypothetical protein